MKRFGIYFALVAVIGCISILYAATPNEVAAKIHRFGQSAVLIDFGGKRIYIDPLQIKRPDAADIIFITHPHQDHFSPDDIAKLVGPDTIFVAPQDCVKDLEARFHATVTVVEPGMNLMVSGIPVETVPAYNISKSDKHPVDKKWVGYIITVGGVRIYHAGDTERIPEMKKFKADIALVPLGQTYTMDKVSDAADAVLDVKAKIAIPMHYGQFEGKDSDAQDFAKFLRNKVTVIIKARE